MVRLAGRLIGPALLLIIAVILVTGLIVPGWLVANRFHNTATPDGSGKLSVPVAGRLAGGADAVSLRRFAGDYVLAFNERDVPAVAALACEPPSGPQLATLDRTLRLGRQTATITGPADVQGDRASVPVTLRSIAKLFSHRKVPRTENSAVLAQRRGPGWCLR
jgi:hypothetical protein